MLDQDRWISKDIVLEALSQKKWQTVTEVRQAIELRYSRLLPLVVLMKRIESLSKKKEVETKEKNGKVFPILVIRRLG